MEKNKSKKIKKNKKMNDANLDPNLESKKKKKKKTKRGWKIFRIFLFLFLALCIVGAGVVLGVISGIVNDTVAITLADLANEKQTSFAYDKDGNQIGQFYSTENRIIVESKDIPKSVFDATISIEDERFYEHSGIDIKRTAGAIFTYIVNGGDSNFGGSTITQQLVKNVMEDDETSWQRKIREWYRALSLEKLIDKEKIITLYLNKVYLGDGCWGVGAAARDFFGKDVSELDIAESAVIGATIQSPEATNPYTSDESRQRLLDRQKLVLQKMLSLGKITQEEYDTAVAEEIEFKRYQNTSKTEVQSYFVDAVFDNVVEGLMEVKGVTKEVAEQMLYTQGYKVYTTMDPKVQNAINEAYNNPGYFYTDSQGDFMQSAMVVIDHTTGNVVGLIGGADEKTGARTYNRATQLKRQLGSCAKPICAYGPAFEEGVLAVGSGLDDSALNEQPVIKEWYGYYNGYVTVRQALARSMNLPAIRANRLVSINTAFNFAKNCGLKSLVEEDKNAVSFPLGGYQYGITVLEAANAYATIANKGVYIEPKLYTKVVDAEGNTVLSNEESTAKVVMKESTAYMLTSCLQSVVTGEGTASGYVNIAGGTIAAAGKTGNTNGDIDQWFCGFTPYYTIACWNGYDKVGGNPGTKEIGSRNVLYTYPYTAIPLFNTVMNKICEGLPGAGFVQPNTVTSVELCKDSGLVATDACKKDPRGSRIGVDLVEVGKAPTGTCTIHKMVKVCKVTGKLPGPNCDQTEERSFITRDGALSNLGIKTSDSGYLAPTETCDKCKKKEPVKVPVKDPDSQVDVYKVPTSTDKNKTDTTKPSTNTTTTDKKN